MTDKEKLELIVKTIAEDLNVISLISPCVGQGITKMYLTGYSSACQKIKDIIKSDIDEKSKFKTCFFYNFFI